MKIPLSAALSKVTGHYYTEGYLTKSAGAGEIRPIPAASVMERYAFRLCGRAQEKLGAWH